jgi:hypothetical protein
MEVCSDVKQSTLDQQEVAYNEPTSTRFQHLLDFLLLHRRAMEYSNADIKQRKSVKIQEAPIHHVQQKTEDRSQEKDNTPRGSGCWLHSTNSHNIQECTAYAKSGVNER